MVKELDIQSLMKELRKGKIIVDFWAPWCGPCKMFGPVFEKVSSQYKDVIFIKVNVQENPEAANQLGIQSIPCIIFFKDGQEMGRFTGVQSEDGFKETISEIF
ncbi:MAG: thioredoxin [Nanoarchaeota archaeon]|nr:thioredoxin [Nanoarchaeota archaeon]